MRINITLADELLSRLDAYANANYMTRSSVIAFSVNQYLMANEMQTLIVDMKRAMQKIADNGEIAEEERKQLERFSVFCDLITESTGIKVLNENQKKS